MQIKRFRVTNYRNILDTDWINVSSVTAFVGQNEAGKSNLFEALYCLNPFLAGATYRADEDWPVDNWAGRAQADGTLVCQAEFTLTPQEIATLYEAAAPGVPEAERPAELVLHADRAYGRETAFSVIDGTGLDSAAVASWCGQHLPKFVLIEDVEMTGTQVELNELKARLEGAGGQRNNLSSDDQTILIILDLAHITLDDFLAKGETPDGRTIRSFDKRSASSYLTNQFKSLWTQKDVKFDIEVDGATLNIFVEDAAVNMPVRLKRRSTGFRWYVSFAWKFTHASGGDYQNCILLLEEPGIHLHYSGQRDLIQTFNRLSEKNTVLYTTHLASMVDLEFPERVRIVESKGHHAAITEGVVSTQQAPMAVIEMSLGLTPDLSGMLGNRQVLIVEGGIDALILHKLSGLLKASGESGLSDHIYPWPAQSASKTPMYAAFALGQKWKAGVLLDSDGAGREAQKKIDDLALKALAKDAGNVFHVLMLADAAGLTKADAGIEDLFPDDFYRTCVSEAYGLDIKPEDLPTDGSAMIASRVERVLKTRYARELDKKHVLSVMLKRFDTWSNKADLPPDSAARAAALFAKINQAFAV